MLTNLRFTLHFKTGHLSVCLCIYSPLQIDPVKGMVQSSRLCTL